MKTQRAPFAYALTICCLLTFGTYVGSYMRIPIVPLFAKTMGADTATVGFINSVFFFTAGLLSFPMGLLSDRWGRKPMAAVGLFILGATSFWLAATRTPLEIMIVYFFFGIGLSTYGPTMMSYVADISPATHLGRSYGWYTTALYTGMSVGPAIGGWIAQILHYRPVFLASGILTGALMILLLFLLPPIEESKNSTGTSKAPGPEMLGTLRNRPLWACWMITLGNCFGLGMFVTFTPLLARSSHIPVAQIGMIFFVQGLVNALSRIPFGHLSDSVKDRRLLAGAGTLVVAVSLSGFALTRQFWQFLVWASMMGAGMALAFTSIGALIAEVVPTESRGLAMGGYNTCIYFGIMAASASMGLVIQRWGYPAAFYSAASLACMSLILFVILFRRSSGATCSLS